MHIQLISKSAEYPSVREEIRDIAKKKLPRVTVLVTETGNPNSEFNIAARLDYNPNEVSLELLEAFATEITDILQAPLEKGEKGQLQVCETRSRRQFRG